MNHRRAEEEIRASKKKEQARNTLQFSKEEKEKLKTTQGTVSVTDKPIEKIFPFTHLGKPLPSPLPKELEPAERRITELAGLNWQEKGYDDFYTYALKADERAFAWDGFLDSITVFTKREILRG